MKRARRLWPTKDPRARVEWDFRADWKGRDERKYPVELLPPEEVWLCHCYEFDRTLPREVESVLESRKKYRLLTFDCLLEEYWRTHGDGKLGIPIVGNWFYTLWPEWPERPYLSFASVDRKKRFDACWPKEKRKRRTLRALPLDGIFKALNTSLHECGEVVRHVLAPRRGEQPVYDGKTITVQRKDHQDGKLFAHVVAAFEIDFSFSATRLAKLFENWCREQQRINGWKEKPNRGQNSDTDRLRTELKNLGAWRLIQTGLTYQRAAEYTKRVSGMPLFADKADWSRAVATAEELLYRYS